MTTIQITGIQHPAGRKTEHVLVFGIRPLDPKARVVVFPIDITVATELITEASESREFPEVEVEDNAWMHCLDTGDLQVIHIQQKGNS